MTYKKNVSDFRESPAFHIIEMLEKDGAVVSYTDPYVPVLKTMGGEYRSVEIESAGLKADLAILVTDHDLFDRKAILDRFSMILDTRNFFKKEKSEKVVRL